MVSIRYAVMSSVGPTAKETRRNVSGRRASTSFVNEVCYDPTCHSFQHRAPNPVFAPRLTSNCDFDSDVDENVECHKVNHFEAQYLLISALVH